jgi:hypothetical protein
VRRHSGAARVIVEAQPPLARLFTQSGAWDAEIFSLVDPAESALPAHDFQIPLLSLPLALGLFEPLPMNGSYLRVEPELRLIWRSRLGTGSGMRVGLVWAGNREYIRDRLRSISPETLLPLFRLPGIQLYSLQAGVPDPRVQPLKDAGLIDLTGQITDFADTAAIVAELDLIISADTAAAHLAGALGRPVWTLLRFQGEWRWGLAGEQTPWYPSMRLFRQSAPGDWDDVIRRVAAELRLLGGLRS